MWSILFVSDHSQLAAILIWWSSQPCGSVWPSSKIVVLWSDFFYCSLLCTFNTVGSPRQRSLSHLSINLISVMLSEIRQINFMCPNSRGAAHVCWAIFEQNQLSSFFVGFLVEPHLRRSIASRRHDLFANSQHEHESDTATHSTTKINNNRKTQAQSSKKKTKTCQVVLGNTRFEYAWTVMILRSIESTHRVSWSANSFGIILWKWNS